MTSDSSPLTKADGKHILEVMDQVLARFDLLTEELRAEMLASEQRIRDETLGSERRVTADFQRGIGIVSEHVAGANADKLSQYQDRLDDHDRRMIVLEAASSGR